MSERLTYVSGKWVTESEAKIHIYDSHFMFGTAVFEMARTFNHQYFLLDEHIDRLFRSMKYVQIPIDKTKEEIKELCEKAIEINKEHFSSYRHNPESHSERWRFDVAGRFHEEEVRLMINVSAGPLGIYREVFDLDENEDWNKPTWIINAWPLSKTAKTLTHLYDTGVNAVVTSQGQIPSRLLENKVKSRSRLHYHMANLEAAKHGKDAHALLLDDDGFVTEGTGANFLLVKNGKLIVPELRNMLRGSSMMYIIENIAPKLKIPVVVKNFEPYDVLEADEAMFTGTFVNILPVNRLNGQYLNDKVQKNPIGWVTESIMDRWSHEVRCDVLSQVKHWGSK